MRKKYVSCWKNVMHKIILTIKIKLMVGIYAKEKIMFNIQ
jgi:hypothetical protein